MKKTLQTIAFPFLKIADWILQLITYTLYVAVRIMKAPLPKAPLDNLKHWNAETNVSINQRSKDLVALFGILFPLLVLCCAGWIWLIITLTMYFLFVLGVLIYTLIKKDDTKHETNEK